MKRKSWVLNKEQKARNRDWRWTIALGNPPHSENSGVILAGSVSLTDVGVPK